MRPAIDANGSARMRRRQLLPGGGNACHPSVHQLVGEPRRLVCGFEDEARQADLAAAKLYARRARQRRAAGSTATNARVRTKPASAASKQLGLFDSGRSNRAPVLVELGGEHVRVE